MKVTLIGATGFVGSSILKELIVRGHDVTAVARNVSQIEKTQGVHPVDADIMDSDALSKLIQGSDAVISAYNAGWSNPNIYEDYSHGAKAIQEATQQSGVKRLIVIGGAGSLLTADGTRIVDGSGFPASIKPGALAAADYYDVLKKNTELDWTLFSPAIELNDEKRRGEYRTDLDHPVLDSNSRSRLSVSDAAIAIVDELEKPQFIQKRFTAGY